MKALRQGLALFVALAATFSLPSGALAALIPPGNSGATQYTESYPTAGGPKQTGGGGHGGGSAPSHVLGARNTRKLNAQGATGRATAEVASATAPSTTIAVGGEAPGQAGRQAPAGQVGGTTEGSESRPSPGSSGLNEVIGQATGSSSGSGQLGPLLPLLIAATVAWSLAFLWRRKRKTAQ